MAQQVGNAVAPVLAVKLGEQILLAFYGGEPRTKLQSSAPAEF